MLQPISENLHEIPMRRQHDDTAKYVACVLWLVGHSYGTIANVLGIKRSQAAGIVNRSEYAGRTSMSRAQRTALLRELEEIRFDEGKAIDGGLLDRVPFKVNLAKDAPRL